MKENSATSIVALGGLGEVGKNMYVITHKDEIIIIDAGVMFPEIGLLGVDYVIQDVTYLKQNEHKIKALFITHGHEDHIGGIPFLLNQVHIPIIYAPKIAKDLINKKLTERNINFKNIEEWYNYQIEIVKNKEYNENCIYQDDVNLYNPRLYKSKQKICSGLLKMYKDRFEVISNDKTYVFEFNKIEAVTLLGKKKMNFYYENKTYQVFKGKRINLLKYLHLFYILKNKKEDKDSEFLGL